MSSIFGHLQQWKFVQQQKWAKIVFFIKVVKFRKILPHWLNDIFDDQIFFQIEFMPVYVPNEEEKADAVSLQKY